MWYHIPIIPAHKRLSQEDCCKLEASLEYIGKKGKKKRQLRCWGKQSPGMLRTQT